MNLLGSSISELMNKMQSKESSSEEIVKKYLQEVKKTDSKLKNYTVVQEESIKRAKEIDSKRKKGQALGRLAGIPLAVTEDISTKGMLTSAGSKMLGDYKPPFNASVVEDLLKEGAIILGKLSIGEFGTTYSDSMAKSVKNKQAVIALGSDSAGKLRQAASRSGLFAIKPSYGAVSRYGIIGTSSSLDQVGVTASSVEDLAITLDSIIKYDEKDSTSVSLKDIDYKSILTKERKQMKIALPKEYFGEELDPIVREKVLSAVKQLEDLGFIVGEVSIPSIEYLLPAYYIISSAELSSNLARYDGIGYGYRTKEYEDLEELYKKSRSESFGLEVKKGIMFGNFVLSSEQYNDYYLKAQEVRTVIKTEFDQVFKEYDLILSPISSILDPCEEDKYTIGANMTGLPAISIPIEMDKNKDKLGFQVMAPAFREDRLLELAYAYEEISSARDEIGGGE